MNAIRVFLKSLTLLLAAMFLSVTTLLFSTVPLMALRLTHSRTKFLAFSLIGTLFFVGVGRIELWAPFLAAVILSGTFVEVQSKGMKIVSAAFVSLLLASGMLLVAISLWAKNGSVDVVGLLSTKVDVVVQQAAALDANLKLNTKDLIYQMPSAIIILMMISLWVSVLWAQKLALRSGGSIESVSEPLSDFRVPDFIIWIFLASVMGAFFDFGNPNLRYVSMNVLNVAVVIYFFQGVSVIATFFRLHKVGAGWQIFSYILIVLQLFLFVGFLGLVDFWADFRKRMIKKTSERVSEV